MTAISRHPDPPRDGRFGWLVPDAWVVRDPDDRDVAYALITAAGRAGDPAEQAMPALAETLVGLSRPGAHTDKLGTVYVTLTDQRCAILHLGDDLHLRQTVPPLWRQAAHTRGWVLLVIGYRVMPSDATATALLAEVLSGRGVTATVPVGHSAPPLASGLAFREMGRSPRLAGDGGLSCRPDLNVHSGTDGT